MAHMHTTATPAPGEPEPTYPSPPVDEVTTYYERIPVTIYHATNDFGNVVSRNAYLLATGRSLRPEDQGMGFVRFTTVREPSNSVADRVAEVRSPFILVLNGHNHPVPREPYLPKDTHGGLLSRFMAFDPLWLYEFNIMIQPLIEFAPNLVIFDGRSTKDVGPPERAKGPKDRPQPIRKDKDHSGWAGARTVTLEFTHEGREVRYLYHSIEDAMFRAQDLLSTDDIPKVHLIGQSLDLCLVSPPPKPAPEETETP